MFKKAIFFLFLLGCTNLYSQKELFQTNNAYAKFVSDAPLELIQAESEYLRGILNISNNTFAFSLHVNTFEGFNSALQKEHFQENYMETEAFPNITFTGKIVEEIDLSKDGAYVVRCKGKLSIHGVSQERIFKSKINTKGNSIEFESIIEVLLEDHDITIPKIVFQKIAEAIIINIKGTLVKRVVP